MDKDYIYEFIGNAVESVIGFIRDNFFHLIWFALYFGFFFYITGGYSIFVYFVTVSLAFSSMAEGLWRSISGVRPLRLKSEKERLLPLFKEVYEGARTTNPQLSKKIRLYIKEDMTINAFAFGRSTLVLTRGSIELLDDNCQKGLIAHEFGHFSHRHTEALLLFMVGNLPMTFIMRVLTDMKNHFNMSENKGTLITSIFRMLFDFIYWIFRSLEFIGDLIIMRSSRQKEYIADDFAHQSSFGTELTNVLIEIYSVSISKPQSVKEQLRSTHPHITLRIEELEAVIY